jgi:hypothetical protein
MIATINNIGNGCDIKLTGVYKQYAETSGTSNVTLSNLENNKMYHLWNMELPSTRYINSITGAKSYILYGERGGSGHYQHLVFIPEGTQVTVNATNLGGNLYEIAEL